MIQCTHHICTHAMTRWVPLALNPESEGTLQLTSMRWPNRQRHLRAQLHAPLPLPFSVPSSHPVAPVGSERPKAAEPATDLILIQAPPGPPDLREER
jgi:hypothetical protein